MNDNLKKAYDAIQTAKNLEAQRKAEERAKAQDIANELAYAEWKLVAKELGLVNYTISPNGLVFPIPHGDGETYMFTLGRIEGEFVSSKRAFNTPEPEGVDAFFYPRLNHQYFKLSLGITVTTTYTSQFKFVREHNFGEQNTQTVASLYQQMLDLIDNYKSDCVAVLVDAQLKAELYSDDDDTQAELDAWKAKAREQGEMVKAIMTALGMPDIAGMDNVEWASLVRTRAEQSPKAEPVPATPAPKRIQVKMVTNPTSKEFETLLNDGWEVKFETRHPMWIKSGLDVAEHFVRFEREVIDPQDDVEHVVESVVNVADELTYSPHPQGVLIMDGVMDLDHVYNAIPTSEQNRPLVELILEYGADAVRQNVAQELRQIGKEAFSKALGGISNGNQ
jgi:hypothetical protein